MKPSDLSIGDWVQVFGTDDRFRIEEMYTVEPMRRKRIMVGGRDHICRCVYFYLNEIEPVPIVGEILTKNGFTRSDSEPKFFHPYGEPKEEPADEVIVMEYDLTRGEWTGDFIGPKGLSMQVQIHYVHELQRIMRCMGIDHDIVV